MIRFALVLALLATAGFAGEDHPQCHKQDSTAVSDTAKMCHKKGDAMDSAQCAKHMAECKKADHKQCCPKKAK